MISICQNCKYWESFSRKSGKCNKYVKELLNMKTDKIEVVKMITFTHHYCDKYQPNGDRAKS